MIKVYIYVAIVAGASLLGWYAHHHIYAQGYDSGRIDGDKAAALAKIDQRDAERRADQVRASFDELSANLEAEKVKARLMQAEAVKAVADANAARAASDAALSAWQTKTAQASRDPVCAKQLEARLCPALVDY